jgi:hypothetical protein
MYKAAGRRLQRKRQARRKSGIHIKPSHEGLLHKNLGVAQDKNIPVGKLEAAKHSNDPAERKRATFALNARHFKH